MSTIQYGFKLIIYCLFAFPVLVYLSSCSSPEKKEPIEQKPQLVKKTYPGIWQFSHQDQVNPTQRQKDYRKKFPQDFKKKYQLSLFPDGRGTIILDVDLDTFIWKTHPTKQATLQIEPEMGIIGQGSGFNSELSFHEKNEQLYLELLTFNGRQKLFFTKSSEPTTNYLDDPFHPDNNKWRIRAKKKINESEIEAKIDNYLNHYRLLFKAAIDKNNKRSFSNKNSKGLLRIYNSGFGIVKESAIDEDWKSYFYSEDEVKKSYEILKKKIKGKNKSTEKAEDWILNNYNLFVAITQER